MDELILEDIPHTDLAEFREKIVSNHGSTDARRIQIPFPGLSAQVDGAVDTSGDGPLRKAQPMPIEKSCPVYVK